MSTALDPAIAPPKLKHSPNTLAHMELTPEQKKQVASWIEAGASIADVQRRLQEELEVALTYMDTRFLIDDLNLNLVDKPPPAKAAPPTESTSTDGEAELVDDTDPYDAAADPLNDDLAAPAGTSAVKVEVDRLTRPGTVVSGTVTFSDGNSGKWALDQVGRLVFESTKPDYRPSQADLQTFQAELSHQLQKQGF